MSKKIVGKQRKKRAKPRVEKAPKKEPLEHGGANPTCPECFKFLVRSYGKAPIQGTRFLYLACPDCPYFWAEESREPRE